MKKSCAPVCQSCDYVTIEGRCPLDPEAVDAWYPGDLDKMFEKLTSEPYLSEYDVQILSSPKTHGPWVITMENVVTEEEATRLIELGGIEGRYRKAAWTAAMVVTCCINFCLTLCLAFHFLSNLLRIRTIS